MSRHAARKRLSRHARPSTHPLPAYQKIIKAIRSRIDSGDLKTGAKIESERDLARIHRVSLMTARHALQELESQGLVTRHIGVGTFVASPKIHFNKLVGFSELMAGRGLSPQSRIVSLQIRDDNQDAAARLGQPFGSKLVRLERLRLADGEPFALETIYLPLPAFGDVSQRHLERRSLFDVLQQDYGIALAHADEEVDATSADTRSAKYLGLAAGAPVLRIRQLLYATTGEPVLHNICLYRPERHSLIIRRYR